MPIASSVKNDLVARENFVVEAADLAVDKFMKI